MRPIVLLALFAPAAALAGCVDDAAAPAALADDAAPPETAVILLEVPVRHEGTTATGAAVCTPVAPCTGPALTPVGGTAFEQHRKGVIVAADLTMTWTAASPAAEELGLGIAIGIDGEWSWEYVRGSSPLRLERTGLDIPRAAEVFVYANGFTCTPTPVAPCVSLPQEFVIEGTLGTLPE